MWMQRYHEHGRSQDGDRSDLLRHSPHRFRLRVWLGGCSRRRSGDVFMGLAADNQAQDQC